MSRSHCNEIYTDTSLIGGSRLSGRQYKSERAKPVGIRRDLVNRLLRQRASYRSQELSGVILLSALFVFKICPIF